MMIIVCSLFLILVDGIICSEFHTAIEIMRIIYESRCIFVHLAVILILLFYLPPFFQHCTWICKIFLFPESPSVLFFPPFIPFSPSLSLHSFLSLSPSFSLSLPPCLPRPLSFPHCFLASHALFQYLLFYLCPLFSSSGSVKIVLQESSSVLHRSWYCTHRYLSAR